jgi:hypothetical protein
MRENSLLVVEYLMDNGSALGDSADPSVLTNITSIDNGIFTAKFRPQNLHFYSQIEVLPLLYCWA